MGILEQLKKVGDRVACLSLKAGGDLEALELVRIVPNKRLVCKAIWQNKVVYAKIFLGDDSEKYAKRDQHGVDLLIANNILTPHLLSRNELDVEEKSVVLIFEAIEGADNAELVYHSFTSQADKQSLMIRLVETVARHHCASILQTDLYLKNFLIKHDDIYSLDGDGVKQYANLSSKQAKLNLATLLSKFDVLDTYKVFHQLLSAYQKVNTTLKLDMDEMKCLMRQQSLKASMRYADNKVLRTCTDVRVSHGGDYFFARSSQYNHINIPSEYEAYEAHMDVSEKLKQGNTCTVGLVVIDAQQVVIKRYNIKNLSHAIGRLIRPTRAQKSWSNAHRLALLHINTPPPIALFEKRQFGILRSQAYFLSAYVNAPDIKQFFEAEYTEEMCNLVVKNVTELFYRMSLLWLSHGDMKATNIKVLDNGEPSLIDLDSMQQQRLSLYAKKSHVRDLKRFMKNWENNPKVYRQFVQEFKKTYAEHALLYQANILT